MGWVKGGALLLSMALLAACERDDVFAGPDASGPTGRLDAGFVAPDAEPRPDAGPTDLGVDAGFADAGEACECPSLPTTCVVGATDRPTFTPPSAPMLEQLFSEVACADSTIRGAFYEVEWDCVVDAFIAKLAADPDVVIELVIDDDRCPRIGGTLGCDLSRLDGHPRVTIVDDERSAYMHHKFMIVDDARVWTGSANLTKRSFCTDANNALVIDSPTIVSGYASEFDRMFTDRQFGPTAPRPIISDGVHSLYFSPESPLSDPSAWFVDLVAAIETASVSVDVMTASWTRTEVSDALLSANARGVRVRSVVLSSYVNDAPTQALIEAGISVKHGTVHDKVAIIDGRLVITGSPNWSQNAWSNNESSLWLDDAAMALTYTAEMDRIFSISSTP